jgi:3HB-oligomer hydrolase (3HBOH)
MLLRYLGVAALVVVVPAMAHAATRCEQILKHIGDELADVTCFESTDLTTNNPLTTPANNSIAGLPAFAFTPQTDRATIAPSAANRPPITKVVPGVQIQARIASDPLGQARFLLRLPDNWNGRLVVAGASGNRSEYNGDFVWSDYVVQRGYAYASQNKGALNLQFVTAADPLGCRLNPASPLFVRFYANEPGQEFTRWTEFIVKAAELARRGVNDAYGNRPRFVYAVGTSNGGYQVRRALEAAPDLFDGGVDAEGTYVDENGPNLLTDLPPAVLNWPDYVASGFNPDSTAAKNIRAAGYPPDIVASPTSTLWLTNWNSFWEVTLCQWQKRLDPTYDTYVSGTGTYNYHNRRVHTSVDEEMAKFANTGLIGAPLVTVVGTMDALLPIDHHARAYARTVKAALDAAAKGKDKKRPAYRLYEVQNGNHLETNKDLFPQLELLLPHQQRAFDLLVSHAALPPDQCIPRGGGIDETPAQPGPCVNLFVP